MENLQRYEMMKTTITWAIRVIEHPDDYNKTQRKHAKELLDVTEQAMNFVRKDLLSDFIHKNF